MKWFLGATSYVFNTFVCLPCWCEGILVSYICSLLLSAFCNPGCLCYYRNGEHIGEAPQKSFCYNLLYFRRDHGCLLQGESCPRMEKYFAIARIQKHLWICQYLVQWSWKVNCYIFETQLFSKWSTSAPLLTATWPTFQLDECWARKRLLFSTEVLCISFLLQFYVCFNCFSFRYRSLF